MRILHISSLYPPAVVGGAERMAAMLAEGQAARGHRVAAAFLGCRDASPSHVNGVDLYPQPDRNLIHYGDVARQRRWVRSANKVLQVANLSAADDFDAAITAFRPDVVHTHSMVELPPMIWRRAKQAGARVVHTLHDYDLLCGRASMFRDGKNCAVQHRNCRLLAAWKRRFHTDIDAVAAVSDSVLERHLQHGFFAALEAGRRRVIWNAVRPGDIRGPRPTSPETAPMIFGFMGRIVPEKGLDVLLEACRRLAPEGWRLRVAGRSPNGFQPPDAGGMPVDYLGFTDPDAFLESIDVLVVPSLWHEPFGLTIAEAWTHGVPVVGAGRGAVQELAARLGPEWAIPAEDPAALAAALTRLIAGGRGGLPTRKVYEPLVAAHSPDRMVPQYLDLYGATRASVAA